MLEEAGSRADAFERCGTGELAELLAFRTGMYGPENRVVDPARALWLDAQNSSLGQAAPSVWICRREGRIVGTNASIPFVLKVGDDEVRSQWGVDLIVDPEWRGQGIAGALNAALRADGRVSCSAGISPAGKAHSIRNGYRVVATLRACVCVLDTGSVRGAGDASTRGFGVAMRTLRAASWVTGMGRRLRRRGSELVAIDSFDDRADAMWSAVSSDYPVIARRDAKWLRWRFDDSPERSHYLRFYLTCRGRAVGYLVLRAATWRGMHAFRVVDYFSARNDLGALFAFAAEAARQRSAKAVLCTTLNASATRPLRSVGFVRLPGASQAYPLAVWTHEHDPARGVLHDHRNWFITTADSDLD